MIGRPRYQPIYHREPPPYVHRVPHEAYPPQQPYTHITPYELYAKPPQPMNWMHPEQEGFQGVPEQPPGILGAFTDENGQVSFDKTMTAINQLASTYHQVTPIVKQLSSLIRTFR